MKINRYDTIEQLCILFESIKDVPFKYKIGNKWYQKYEGKNMFSSLTEDCTIIILSIKIFIKNKWSIEYKCMINIEERYFNIKFLDLLKRKTTHRPIITLHKLNEKVIREGYDEFVKRANENMFCLDRQYSLRI